MVWTYLRSCYSFTMRLYIGGVETHFPARFYWCLSTAKLFPFAHGCESSVWLKNYEINDQWGEVTPYPTDSRSFTLRGLDRGLNPGYPGLCFIGQDSWFVDGMLPAGILDGPIPPMPVCCRPPPAKATGGLILGGSAIPTGRRGAVGRGGLILGGAARGGGPVGAAGSGGIVVGGRGAPSPGHTGVGQLGLVLGGKAIAGRPGSACDSAPSLSVPGDTGVQPPGGDHWYAVTLAAGTLYHVVITDIGSDIIGTPGALWAGPCSNLTLLAGLTSNGCTAFSVPSSGVYHIEITAGSSTNQWRLTIDFGPCP
jgi:hypothetical protein